jgi:hypothetical protein
MADIPSRFHGSLNFGVAPDIAQKNGSHQQVVLEHQLAIGLLDLTLMDDGGKLAVSIDVARGYQVDPHHLEDVGRQGALVSGRLSGWLLY